MSLLTNLVSYYKLQGNSNDSVGSNNGTDTAITYGDAYGKIGNGVLSDGSTSRITDNGLASTFNGTAFSFSYWYYNQGATEYGEPFSAGTNTTWGSDTYECCIRNKSSTQKEIAYVNWSGSAIFSLPFTVPTTGWHHIVLTYSSGSWNVYVDAGTPSTGTQTIGVTFTNATLGNTCFTNIGYRGLSVADYFDEVGIWSRALTSGEVTSLYNGGAGFQYPFLPSALPSVSDTGTVTESVTILITTLYPSAVDTVTITENTQLTIALVASVFDSVTTTEGITVFIPILTINVSDSVSVSELSLVRQTAISPIVENVTISESVTLLITTLYLEVVDSITVTEDIMVAIVISISVVDSVTASESFSALIINIINSGLNDTITISEYVSFQIPLTLPIIFEAINITENYSSESLIQSPQIPRYRPRGFVGGMTGHAIGGGL